MALEAVKSSAISHVGYDKNRETLTVKFHNGGTHEFFPVPEEAHTALMGADSIGKHFQQHIRPKFTSKKLS